MTFCFAKLHNIRGDIEVVYIKASCSLYDNLIKLDIVNEIKKKQDANPSFCRSRGMRVRLLCYIA